MRKCINQENNEITINACEPRSSFESQTDGHGLSSRQPNPPPNKSVRADVHTKKMKPTFPLLDLGDGFPPEKSSIEMYFSLEDLGRCTRLAALKNAFSDERRFYDRNGNIWMISEVNPPPVFSKVQRILCHVCYNPIQKYTVTLGKCGEANVTEMINRINLLLEHDPGDILYQWTDERAWQEGLSSVSNATELFDFVVKASQFTNPKDDCEPFDQPNPPSSGPVV
jgi:hypothetical protein